MNNRTYRLLDNEVAYYAIVTYYNHSRLQYNERCKGWLRCRNKLVRHILGWFWIATGLRISNV